MTQKHDPSQYEEKKFGELTKNDVILTPTNQETRVTQAYQTHLPQKMFELTFADGTTINASGNHLWYIESTTDKQNHADRIKKTRKTLQKIITPQIETKLLKNTTQTHTETTLTEIFHLLECDNEHYPIIARIAESIGHVAEETIIYEDLYDGEQQTGDTIRTYDAQLFSQQILSLSHKKHARKWPIIKGRVVTTEDLFHEDLTTIVDIPHINQRKIFKTRTP